MFTHRSLPPFWYLRFWFSWFVATAFYIIAIFLSSDGASPLFRKVALFLATITPMGVWNAFLSLHKPLAGVVNILLLFIFFYGVDKVASRLGVSSALPKLLFNVVALFVLTLLVDLVIYQQPISFLVWENGGHFLPGQPF